MELSNLENKYKINLLSESPNLFNNGEVYTKYSILKYNDCLYMLYKGIHHTGKILISSNKITELKSVIMLNDIEIEKVNCIEEGEILKGKYDNGFDFFIPTIINIRQEVMSSEEIEYCKEGVN